MTTTKAVIVELPKDETSVPAMGGAVEFERGIHGMEPVVVATFPTKKFNDDFFSPGEDSQCTVCLAEYQKKDILRILPYCNHYFHVTCIDTWLQQHSTCPVCRISLRSSPERKFTMQPISTTLIRSYDLESLDSHSDHCFYNSHGHSSQGMEPIQEDQFASEQDAAEAGECSTTASIQVRIDIGHHDSEISSSRVHPIHDNP
ncbi:Ring-h2 finger protein atl10 [Thalictrum thalictroides]|uniref:Ring-h2 finger protein atl10 n=1 Tax=Thalictrum thalictroides TaxID=46969 RepID=A0A7J6X4R1_THATH|nr:Ring-h2 finger protein atl10 [Thalictrum thalictroides]